MPKLPKAIWLAVTGAILLTATGCASQTAEPVAQVNLQDQYLQDIQQVDASHFANNQAALSYLKQFCEIRLTGGVATMDAIETVASKYCDTDLAAQLGVKTLPTPSVSIDEAAFTAKAKKIDPELFKVLSDGSFIEPVSLAQTICAESDNDIFVMHKNLAGYWNSSFQKYAIEQFCPSRLPK